MSIVENINEHSDLKMERSVIGFNNCYSNNIENGE